MGGIFERMGKDWAFVCGEYVEEADLQTVKLLAGLHPSDRVQREKIRKALGLSLSAIVKYENELGTLDEDGMGEGISGDEETETTGTGEKEGDEDIIFSAPSAFPELDIINRIKIYQRMCSLKRSLLSPPLVTSKRGIYNELNLVVCHVSIRSYT